MSIELPPELQEPPKETPSRVRSAPREQAPDQAPPGSSLADGGLVALLLALTFLLGVFPLKDTDFYWHLKTGDWIRQHGRVPSTDLYTFSREGVPWIDLHWLFQIAISWVYQHGGIVALNLAKCVVTSVAMLLLVTARRRDWPVWVMVLAWIPALLVLGGRIYVRPETLTLLYLSIFLAILFRWDRHPRLALLLPLVQVAWVNSHGLFVLGPILLVFALVDALLRFGVFSAERRRWWKTILAASFLTGAACLINPYFLSGALYPLELAGTMSNPIFSRSIAELTPIPEFIRRAGVWNLSLQLHFATMLLGALSFVVPLGWRIGVKLMGPREPLKARPQPAAETGAAAAGRSKKSLRAGPGRRTVKTKRSRSASASETGVGWRLSPFRLLLFVAFSLLSLQATRNSHQFAAVVGTITAWNFGEWAAAVRRRRLAMATMGSPISSARPRLAAFVTIIVVLLWVGSGAYYQMTGEGRVISLGEQPAFFAHAAARFAGEPGMPSRFLSFHNGHASLFEYYHGPERKVYTDPRLEVAGADLFTRYTELGKRISKDEPGWDALLGEMGRPVIMVDHDYNWEVGTTLLRSDHWRCVWFDEIVAVFVHDSNAAIVRDHLVDFGARHFRPEPSAGTPGLVELSAANKAYRSYQPAVSPPGGRLHDQFTWLAVDSARRMLREGPGFSLGWKCLGQAELYRELMPDQALPRFRAPFDPVLDLSMVRATYALRRASELAPRDFTTLLALRIAYESRLMYEAALPIMDRLAGLYSTNPHQSTEQANNDLARAAYVRKLGSPPATSWRNLSELDQIVTAQLAAGRAASAVVLLEEAYPAEKASWEIIDKIVTLRLHLGEPARARAILEKATSPPRPAVREARIATTYFVEGDFDAARRHYQQAIQADPGLFEALYCLAVLEQDSGDASAAYELASKAVRAAPDDTSKTAARHVAAGASRFARRPTPEVLAQ
jgi:tetratricopeptide (TPR) repeat protein